MALLVKNITNGNLVDIEGIQMLGIQETSLATGAKGFAVVCYHQPPMMGARVGYKLAEFTKRDDAETCLERVTQYKVKRDAELYLAVENRVEASIIELPSDKITGSILVK